MPRISIVVPTFNRAALLPEALRSVLAQTRADWELVVVDDGSTDTTPEVMQPFLSDPRVLYRPQRNQGLAAARNAGVAASTSDVIAFLDSDDAYLPSAVARHLAVFERQPEVGLTIAGCEYVAADGTHLSWRAPWTEGGELDLRGWLFNCYAMPGMTAVRRTWFERVGGFDPDYRIAEDWHFFLRLAALGCPMTWVREPTIRYRQHADSLIRSLAPHLEHSLRGLEAVLARPETPDEARAQGPAARAWVHVEFARRALAAGQSHQATNWLREAVRLDPSLGANRRMMATEHVLTPPVEWTSSQAAYGRSVALHLPPELRPTPLELRRLLARLEMRAFFYAAGQGRRAEARAHLSAALRQDPTWLANRGVLAFLARRPRRTAKAA